MLYTPIEALLPKVEEGVDLLDWGPVAASRTRAKQPGPSILMLSILRKTFLSGLLPLLAGCLGSTSSNSVTHADQFEIDHCSLGCHGATCTVNTIATNQDIVITFNDEVRDSSANYATISLVSDISGATPPGTFFVDGEKIIFRPSLIETEAGLSFGFVDGDVYRLRVYADPEWNVVRSVIGRPNLSDINCGITTSGVTDLSPGPPSVVVTPDASTPPVSSDFSITLVFNDLMQKSQLLNEATGGSPSISVKVEDKTSPETVVVSVPGTYSISFDQDALTSTLVFTPLAPFPGGHSGDRTLKVFVSPQIADIANNAILNPGEFSIPLPEAFSAPGSFAEGFSDNSMEDVAGSTSHLWAEGTVGLDSGLQADTGIHEGGGSGILGVFAPTEDYVFDTSLMTMKTVTGVNVTITDGVFPFEEVHIPAGVRVSAVGPNPLRLLVRGQMLVEGILDVSGENASPNFGKYFPRFSEIIQIKDSGGNVIASESSGGIFESEAEGGLPGIGYCAAGSGGRGGGAWYLLDGAGGLLDPNFYDDANPETLVAAEGEPDPSRFTDKIRWTSPHGRNGAGVGGVAPTGDPELSALNIPGDLAEGSGMGSWAWPTASNFVLDDIAVPPGGVLTGTRIQTHLDPSTLQYSAYSIHRSRGGGGGGFWTDGVQGDYFDSNSTNPLLQPLTPPVSDAGNSIWEFNDRFNWDAKVGDSVPDASGGAYSPVAGIETLDPDLNLLLGGSGGGGAGMSQHGSYSLDPNTNHSLFNGNPSGLGWIDSFRTCSGAGGGAGGGALQIHTGGRFAVTGLVSVDGGDGGDSEFMLNRPYSDFNAINFGPPGDAGGGGGSGGSILLQAGGILDVGSNTLSLSGGEGGLGSVGNHGGDGGSGVIRFETNAGDETLAALQTLVSPDESVDLAPIGSSGLPNRVIHEGDFGASTPIGSFSSNASGVRSHWFLPANNVMLLDFSGYRITCTYNDGLGGGDQSIVYESGGVNYPQPGTSPIWVSFQTGWAAPGSSTPDDISLSDWIIPGQGSTTDGLSEIRGTLSRMIRFNLVFDHDIIAGLPLWSDPSAFFRVDEVHFDWVGE
ncbi:MAG: Ig-like domain-containing protein [Planctomycetota bacterium]|nr:Ig-like domain-containing protein [Planctomycetota bacterium]